LACLPRTDVGYQSEDSKQRAAMPLYDEQNKIKALTRRACESLTCALIASNYSARISVFISHRSCWREVSGLPFC